MLDAAGVTLVRVAPPAVYAVPDEFVISLEDEEMTTLMALFVYQLTQQTHRR